MSVKKSKAKKNTINTERLLLLIISSILVITICILGVLVVRQEIRSRTYNKTPTLPDESDHIKQDTKAH
jgi:hypothetical protein